MKLTTLCPIDVDSPQEYMARAVATILAIEGVEDVAALPVAISIFSLLEDARTIGVRPAIERAIREPQLGPRVGTRRRKNRQNRLADSLSYVLRGIP